MEVADPFRPLEDADRPATKAWVAEENALTERYLSAVADRPEIRRRIAELWDYPKEGVPFEAGGRWFQFKNEGLEAQSVLYVGETPAVARRVLVDPNTMSADGTIALGPVSPSIDGRLLCYSTSEAGSDWQTWHVLDVESGADLGDTVEWSKFSGAAWAGSGAGFFYSALDRPGDGRELTESATLPRILFHRLGSDQIDDEVVFASPDEPEWIPHATTTDDGLHLVLTVTRGTAPQTRVLTASLSSSGGPGGLELLPLVPGEGFASRDEVVEADGDGGWFVFTDRDAERGRVVKARTGQDPSGWVEVVAETGETLHDVRLVGGRLVCHYLRDAHSVLRVHDLRGGLVGEIDLPGLVSVPALSGRPASTLLHFQVVSYTQPGAIWCHDLATGRTEAVTEARVAFEPSRYLTEQVWAESADGTRVPMLLTRAAGTVPDGKTRVLLYGYGGFDVALTPWFSVSFAAWLDRGGALAVANLRGGGEYGKAWHDAGRLAAKQNVFDDFCACARWLVSSGWSTPSRIAISGASNGGLLVGACITQHPELFGAAVPEVGVLDMLRFHRWTIGWAWKSDYGDPEDPDDFARLLAYSPLHNLRPGTCYPPTLVMTGDHDDRVVPAHSYKFAAALQQAQTCANPILLRVSESAGHGAGKPTSKLVDEAADRMAFLDSVLER